MTYRFCQILQVYPSKDACEQAVKCAIFILVGFATPTDGKEGVPRHLLDSYQHLHCSCRTSCRHQYTDLMSHQYLDLDGPNDLHLGPCEMLDGILLLELLLVIKLFI